MKSPTVILCLTLLAFVVLAFSLEQPDQQETFLRLRITSAQTTSEVLFSGCYAEEIGVMPDQCEHVESRETPFEIELTSDEMLGLFRKIEGEASLRVGYRLVIDGTVISKGFHEGESVMLVHQGKKVSILGL